MQIEPPIAILGFGIEGQALYPWLKTEGYSDITICDEKQPETMPVEAKVRSGAQAFQNLSEFKTLFRSPGIAIDRPEIQEAIASGTQLTSLTKLFFELCPCPIIGVTGTKGKGTTSSLITLLLKKAGKDVYLGGNIGEPPLNFLDKLTADSWVVLELSSFQLEDLTKSPHLAVVLNITEDHQDVHPSMEAYRAAKTSIARYQGPQDFLIFNNEYEGSRAFCAFGQGKKIPYDRRTDLRGEELLILKKPLLHRKDIALRGEHNLENVLPAATVATLLRILPEIIRETLREFKGLPHRLEPVLEAHGVLFVNDSFSTVPDTSMAAIKSFTEPLYLIAGGSEKHSDFTQWGKTCREASHLKAILLMGDTAERMAFAIGSEDPRVHRVENLENAFQFLKGKLQSGDVVLMSPACASFGLFENYKQRGERFKTLAKEFFA